jgi:hypothetical protein
MSQRRIGPKVGPKVNGNRVIDLHAMAQDPAMVALARARQALVEWGPWEELDITDAPPELGLDRAVRNARCCVYLRGVTSDTFCAVDRETDKVIPVPILHLAVIPHQGLPDMSWEDLQRIKNEMAGEKCLTLELYPEEERRLDMPERHLWAFPPGFRLSLGFTAMQQHVDPAGEAIEGETVAPPTALSENVRDALGLPSAVEDQASEAQAADELAALRASMVKRDVK